MSDADAPAGNEASCTARDRSRRPVGQVLPGSLVLLRHGQSTANAAGIFTGLLDVPLSPLGEQEAVRAGAAVAALQPRVGVIVRSTMHRAAQTTAVVIDALGDPAPLVRADWRLNERNYGALTGRTKSQVLAEVGPEQFLRWRRTMTGSPPPMTREQLAAITRGATEEGRPRPELGLTESLDDVIRRVRPVLKDVLIPTMRRRSVLVVAHGNSLRALVALIEGLGDDEVESLNLPTGQPLVYRLAGGRARDVVERGWLDAATAEAAAEQIAREGGT